MEKLLKRYIANIIPQNENFPGKDIFELTNYRMFTFRKHLSYKLLNFLNKVKGTTQGGNVDARKEEYLKKLKKKAKIVDFIVNY